MKPQLLECITNYLLFLPILTIHEAAHAWAARRRGDDTAKKEGRLSLNPLVHVDVIGTVAVPVINMALGGPLIGWGKPVPVNSDRFGRRRSAGQLIAMAGPMANVALAAVALMVARVCGLFELQGAVNVMESGASLSVYLAFFNLIPIAPLDGARVLKNATGMSDSAYARFCAIGFLILLLLIQAPQIRQALALATEATIGGLLWLVYLLPLPGA